MKKIANLILSAFPSLTKGQAQLLAIALIIVLAFVILALITWIIQIVIALYMFATMIPALTDGI